MLGKKTQEIETLKQQISELQSMMTPEQSQTLFLRQQISDLSAQETGLRQRIASTASELSALYSSLCAKKQLLIQMDEEILLQEIGIYRPTYDFCTSDEYKARLMQIREQQKNLIRTDRAVSANTNWVVNGSQAQGRQLISDTKKLHLRAFNTECDEVIGKVKYSNFEPSKKRIMNTASIIAKLGKTNDIYITGDYFQLKIDELFLAFEYQMKKQQEKEEQKAAREALREEQKLIKEIEEARQRLSKEKSHYARAVDTLKSRLESAKDSERKELLARIEEGEQKLEEIQRAIEDVDYREANKRAGYVYIISNIGAFGEGIYKIGMTRRLTPIDRVDELGDASVPFGFDVHALIFSDDAPSLENALHKAFESKRVNMVNLRREFFRVSLDEIKAVVRENYDKVAEFVDLPDAEQFRVSEKMKASIAQ